MKKSILFFFGFLAMVLAISNCGSSVKMSKEMQEFVDMIKGKAADVSAALTKFGATEDITKNDMAMYDLKDPKVTANEGECYTVEFSAGMTTRVYSICWKEGKINAITEKAVK